MLPLRSVFAILTAASFAVSTAQAQTSNNHALLFQVRGGGYNALTNLNSSGSADTKLGFNAGGGVGVQLHKYFVIRGDFTFGRDELRNGGLDTGTNLNKFIYTGALQLQYPTAGGVTPYVFAGGGGITIHEVGTSGLNKTKAAGVGGLGVRYRISNSKFAVFTEGLGYLYKARDFGGSLAGFNKNQFELAWSGGVSYAVGF